MSFTIYDSITDLPILTAVPGNDALVRENNSFYTFLDLSLKTTYSYEFAGVSSYLSIPNVLDAFPNSTDEFTIDFWSYSTKDIKNPVFTIETPTITYSFDDQIGNSLDILGSPKSFYISPYDSDVTSEWFSGNDRIRSYDVQSTLPTVNLPFQIEYSTRQLSSTFTLFSSYKADKAEPILEINNNEIITNGISLTGDISYGVDSWQHNRLIYDGFDYSFYKNGEIIPLDRPAASDFTPADNISINQINVFRDTGFECKVTFPINPTNGVLFELGGDTNRMRVELINNGSTLFFTAGVTTQNLSVSITDFPKDGLEHIVTWDVQINPARIRLWIDGILKGQSLKSVPITNNLWGTSDKIIDLNDATSFRTYNSPNILYNDGTKYSVYFPWILCRLSPYGHDINKNGNNIYYFEIECLNTLNNWLTFAIFDPDAWSTQFSWYAKGFGSPYSFRYYDIRNCSAGDTISVFINEKDNVCYFFRNKHYFAWLAYGSIGRSSGLKYMLESYYSGVTLVVKHDRSEWKYDPVSFGSNIINIGPEGAYGSNYLDGVKSNPWPGELISDLRTYPQCISSLNEGSFNIGNRYIPSNNTNNNGYKGYIKDFHASMDSALTFNNDSDLTDSDFLNGNIKNLTVPTQSLEQSSNSKFLLKSEATGGVILSYETDGTLKVNGKSYLVDSAHAPFNWKHKSISYDGEVIRVFDNGILEYKDSISLAPYSLSDATLNIGRGTFVNSTNATYNNYFLNGNLSDFRITASSLIDSDFKVPTDVYTEDSTILLTANKSQVENSLDIVNVNTVRSVVTSPFSATTRTWFKYGVLSDKLTNISYVNNHFYYEFPDSYSNNDNSAISAIVELNKKDASGTDLFWKADIVQPEPPILSLKQLDNKFLIEPIVQGDSYSTRDLFLSFTGYRADSQIPAVITAELDPIVTDLRIDINYNDNIVSLTERNNPYIMSYFNIKIPDSADDSDFNLIQPLPFVTYDDLILITTVDSIGALP